MRGFQFVANMKSNCEKHFQLLATNLGMWIFEYVLNQLKFIMLFKFWELIYAVAPNLIDHVISFQQKIGNCDSGPCADSGTETSDTFPGTASWYKIWCYVARTLYLLWYLNFYFLICLLIFLQGHECLFGCSIGYKFVRFWIFRFLWNSES